MVLVILNLPLVGIFVNFLRIPYTYLAPTVLVVCTVGVYGVSSNIVDIALVAIFGVVGYLLRKFRFELAPFILAVVLGDRIELSFRRALTISEGSFLIFIKSSFSQVFLIAVLLILVLQTIAWLFGFRVRGNKEVP